MEWKEDEKIKENDMINKIGIDDDISVSNSTTTTIIINDNNNKNINRTGIKKGILSIKTKENKMKENKNRVIFSSIPEGK